MFTKEILRAIRPRIEDHLKLIEDELAIKFKVGNGSFSPNNATFKLELTSVNEDGSVVTREASQFLELCSLVGLTKEDLGRVITYAGNAYKITGLNLRSSKFPILVQRIKDGKGFKLPREAAAPRTAAVVPMSNVPTIG